MSKVCWQELHNRKCPQDILGSLPKGCHTHGHSPVYNSVVVRCLFFPPFPALTYNFPNSLFPDLKGVRSLLGSKGKKRKWSSPHILHATSANQASKVILSQKLSVGHLLLSIILQISLKPSPFKSKT